MYLLVDKDNLMIKNFPGIKEFLKTDQPMILDSLYSNAIDPLPAMVAYYFHDISGKFNKLMNDNDNDKTFEIKYINTTKQKDECK